MTSASPADWSSFATLPRATKTVLVLDVVESVRLMEQDEADTVHRWQAVQNAVGQLLAQHQGRLVKSLGDGMMLEFDQPQTAAYCALAVQAAMPRFNQGYAADRHMALRIGIHTALARIEGRSVGLMANNPHHLGGAIDADAADKAARFMQLCNAHGLPMVSLVDTPGFMVGPEVEAQAQVRHVSRMFIAAAHLRVPFFSVVLRKGYGLGAMAMCAGGFHAPDFTVAWPTGEFGGMGLEGAVRLGYRKELEAASEGVERDALFARLVAKQYESGQAMNLAATLEIDAVIDPAQTREWLGRGLACAKVRDARGLAIDAW